MLKKPLFCLLLLPFCVMAQSDSARSKHILVFPVVAKSIETGWSFGTAGAFSFRISKADTLSRTSNMQAIVLYSLKKQFIAALNGTHYFKKERFILNEQISYSSFPDKFWGLGNKTTEASVENYSFNQYYIYLHLMRHLGNKLFIGTLFEFQNVMNVKYDAGGIFDQQNIAGRNGYKSSGLGLSFTYDNRNDAYAPNKGVFAQLYYEHFDNVFGSDFDYNNIVVDIRKYIRTYKQQVLALQAYSLSNTGHDVPIRSIAALGGANSMRGFYSGRYRDKQLLVVQSEYRVPLFRRVGVVGFASAGDVSKNLGDFSFDALKYSYGGGLRFALNKKEKLNLRLDYGFGSGNNKGLYFQLGEAF